MPPCPPPSGAAQGSGEGAAPVPVIGPERTIVAFGDSLFGRLWPRSCAKIPPRGWRPGPCALGKRRECPRDRQCGLFRAIPLLRGLPTCWPSRFDAQEDKPDLFHLSNWAAMICLRGLSPEGDEGPIWHGDASMNWQAARHSGSADGMRSHAPITARSNQAEFDALYRRSCEGIRRTPDSRSGWRISYREPELFQG